MTSKAATEGGGLVQKLLFPGFAQSGANDAFSPATLLLHENNNNNPAPKEEEEESHAAVESSSTVMSQAETEIFDNRSRNTAALLQKKTASSAAATTTTTSSSKATTTTTTSNSTAPTSSGRSPQILPRWNHHQTTAPRNVPPLFASTQPPRTTTITPPSPPKLARKPFATAQRSLSNVALADGERLTDKHSLSQEILPMFANDEKKTQHTLDDVAGKPTADPETTKTTRRATVNDESSPKLPEVAPHIPQSTSSSMDAAIDDYSEHKETDRLWQEEATPAQTALAKDIIFRHRVIKDDKEETRNGKDDPNGKDDDDDVSSTASEMGTVIGATQLQDLDRDFGSQPADTNTSPMESPSRSNDDLYSKPVWDKEQQTLTNNTNARLDMPVLPDEKQARKVSHDLSAEASQRLSRAIRRIGSGLKGGIPSRSAPTTPRPANETGSPPSPRTPSWKPPYNRGATPSSFLLRSPGSSAFCAANNSHAGNALLSPRFMQVPPAIAEDKQSPGPAIPELHSNPLSMARACFSFDAYYQDMDETPYDMPYPSYKGRRSSSKRSPRRGKSSSKDGRTQLLHESQSWDVGARGTAQSFEFPEPAWNEGRRQTQTVVMPESKDVEREDALDLLTCLVERGISLDQGVTAGNNDDDHASLAEKVRTSLADEAHQEYLNRLLQSHEYALEMSRASQSAASWLKSIGREMGQQGGTENIVSNENATANTKMDDDSIDLVTARALLHSAQINLTAKSEEMERLNQELAKCRAEIGRLQMQQAQQGHVAPFQSPNRSILDSQNDDDDEEDDTDDEEDIAADRNDGYLDRSMPAQSRPNIFNDGAELTKYKTALEEANKRIRELHEKTKGDDSDGMNLPAPVVSITPFTTPGSPGNNTTNTLDTIDAENFETEWGDLIPSLPPPPDHGLNSPIVQTVLEAWTPDTDLHESLLAWIDTVMSGTSPHDIPPLAISNLDSQVRDGLVMHVLPLLLRRADIRVEVQTRTLRRTTYDLAVSIETSSTNLIDLPLRTRHWENLSARSEAGASVTHSTVTALAENKAFPAAAFRERSRLQEEVVYGQNPERHMFPYPLIHQDATVANKGFSYDEMTEDLTGNGSEHPPGLMSALGDAIGGFMLRRPSPREAASPTVAVVGSHLPEADRYLSALKEGQSGNMEADLVQDDSDKTPTAANGGGSSSSSSKTFTSQQHVSTTPMLSEAPDSGASDCSFERYAQCRRTTCRRRRGRRRRRTAALSSRGFGSPGRIGVTFVEYRGHAMVSKVAADSPLSGWMFPSDILIAIDELPVSGMRVRDIVQILRERVDNQRALRIISSHSMDHAFSSATNSSSSQIRRAYWLIRRITT